VANHLLSLGLFSDDIKTLDVVISSAILHDVLEDTSVTVAQLSDEFSTEIATVVNLLTKTADMTNEVYYGNVRMCLISSLIKIADRCNNVSTMAGVFDKERLQKYVIETNDVVRPLIRHTRDNYPAVSDKVVCMSYHIKSVITAIEVMLPMMQGKVGGGDE
jgi:GTP pyrophosphokinase